MYICPNLTSSQISTKNIRYKAKVVNCKYATNLSYTKGIECKHYHEMQEFQIDINRVSTNFDPELYTKENKF